ncbi:MAG: hypothetical protein ACMUHU_00405 [Thermoplasmatota archaeon]
MKAGIKRTKLHSDEQILLFLSEFSGKRDLWDVPQEVSQKGLAKRLGILENNVSRSLKRLTADELVDSTLKHVKGEKRRQKAYFLTQKGERVVEGLRAQLEQLSIMVVVDGEMSRAPLLRAYRKAREAGIGLTLAELYLHRSKKDQPVDLTPGWEPLREGPSLFGNYQMPVHFFGREEELSFIEDYLRSRSGVLIIWGLAGMGKTSLVLKGMSESTQKTGYIRCEPWTDRVELANEISWVLSQMGFEEDAMELLKDDVSPGQLARRIRSVASSAKGLTLIIDDLQKTGGGLDVYMEGLCKTSMEVPGLKVIILTRERPSFLDPRYEVQGSVRTLELKGLDLKSVALMIKETGKGGDIGAVWDMTKGHPLHIELITSAMGAAGRTRFGEFLDQEVLAPLPPQQKNVLKLAALAGVPVHRSLVGRTSSEDIDILERKGLLREIRGGLLFIHDIISDHLKTTIPTEERRRVLDEITAYQLAVILRIWADGPELLGPDRLREIGASDRVSSLIVEHYSAIVYEDEPALRDLFKSYLDMTVGRFIETGEKELALSTVMLLNTMSGVGRGKVLLGPILKLERSRLSDEHLFALRMQKAMIETVEGEMVSASRTLDLIEATYPKNRIKGKDLALFQHIRGKISRSQKRYEQTISAHNKAIETYGALGDMVGAAKERLHLSKTLHLMGETQKAYREAIRSASEYEKALDRVGEVYACLQAFRSAKAIGREEGAQKCLNRAKEVSRSIGDRRLLALIELEDIMLSDDLPDRTSLERVRAICTQVPPEDRGMVVKGYLSIAREYDIAGRNEDRELACSCLQLAWETLSELERTSKEGSFVNREEHLLNLVDLLEQAVALEENVGISERANLFRATGLPLLDPRMDDPREGMLERLIESYRELADLQLRSIRETGGDPNRFDNAIEGSLHTQLLLGIHYRDRGKKKKAREAFKRCRSDLSEYERTITTIPDHLVAFDLRKVKEVLEENRSATEGDGV